MTERTTMDGNSMFLLGKIEGQLREVIHAQNNMAAKIDAMSIRLAALEAESHQKKGAAAIWTMILKSPAVGWMIGVLGAVSAYLYGRTQ